MVPTTASQAPTTEPSPPVRPRLPAWARAVIPVVLFLPAAMAIALPLAIPGVAELAERYSTLGALVMVCCMAVSLAVYVGVAFALVRWVDRRRLGVLGLRFGGRAALSLVAGVAVSVLIGVAGNALAHTLGWGREIGGAEAFHPYPVLALMILLLGQAFVLQGIGEEVLFRGYVLQTLNRWPFVAVLVAAIGFTVPHLASSGGQQNLGERLLYLCVPFGFSISAAALGIALRSVWAAVGIHGGFHVATYWAVALGLGVEGGGVWVLLGSLHLVVGVVVALMIPRRRWAEMRAHGPYGGVADSSPQPV